MCTIIELIGYCYCRVLFIVYQAWVIVIVVHFELLFICIVYCHCLLLSLFIQVIIFVCCSLLISYCNVFCIGIVLCYHCSLLFVTLLYLPFLLFIYIRINVHWPV